MKIKVAACSLVDTDIIRTWFEDLNEKLSDDRFDDSDIGAWVIDNYDRIEGRWNRLLFAYETIYENACDPTVRHLEWKPEIKALLERAAEED